jgi:hypothetical protein
MTGTFIAFAWPWQAENGFERLCQSANIQWLRSGEEFFRWL